MNRFIHIGYNWVSAPKMKELEPVIASVCYDWLRYSPNTWIVWTNKSPTEIYQVLVKHMTASDSVFISGLDLSDKMGFMPKWAWEWIDAKNDAQFGVPTNKLTGGTGFSL